MSHLFFLALRFHLVLTIAHPKLHKTARFHSLFPLRGEEMTQWLERSTPTAVSLVRVPDLMSHVG